MPVTIRINGTVLSLVHKMSNGISIATIPDVCKTPSPAGPVPIPYPNIAQSITLSNGTTTVKGDKVMAANKGSKFALSNGDQAGTIGGVKSNVFMKEATWILYSFDVKMDGKNAARLTDKMFHNQENTVNLSGEGQPGTGGGDSGEDSGDSKEKKESEKKAKDSSKAERHGDRGRRLESAKERIKELEEEAAKLERIKSSTPGASKRIAEIRRLIKNIRTIAEKAAKGVEHGRRGR